MTAGIIKLCSGQETEDLVRQQPSQCLHINFIDSDDQSGDANAVSLEHENVHLMFKLSQQHTIGGKKCLGYTFKPPGICRRVERFH